MVAHLRQVQAGRTRVGLGAAGGAIVRVTVEGDGCDAPGQGGGSDVELEITTTFIQSEGRGDVGRGCATTDWHHECGGLWPQTHEFETQTQTRSVIPAACPVTREGASTPMPLGCPWAGCRAKWV